MGVISNHLGVPFCRRTFGGGGKEPLPPELKEALVGVWVADVNTNASPERNIIKNLIPNRGGDFEILNSSYSGNSGYGLDNHSPFTAWSVDSSRVIAVISPNVIDITQVDSTRALLWRSTSVKVKYRVTGVSPGKGIKFGSDNGSATYSVIAETDGVYEVDWSLNLVNGNPVADCIMSNHWTGECNITIEQIIDFQGAFVTDGVDDLIVSQKNTSEILDFNKDFTVISMITQLKNEDGIYANKTNTVAYNNYQCNSFIKRTAIDKTGIFGYYKKDAKIHVINDILGDKYDYIDSEVAIGNSLKPNIIVVGDVYKDGYIGRNSSIAWYWTLIANRVLTTDEINQFIAYYDLDKYLSPDVYYDIKKQEITNENHTSFGNRLIDYSGNGRDMQLHGFGWAAGSGVGLFGVDFKSFIPHEDVATFSYTGDNIHISKALKSNANLFFDTKEEVPSMRVRVTGTTPNRALRYLYTKIDGSERGMVILSYDGIYDLPQAYANKNGGVNGFMTTGYRGDCDITIEQIPQYPNALVTDGTDDYGKTERLPIYEDYTVVAERALLESPGTGNIGAFVSKAYASNQGAFILDEVSNSLSFGTATKVNVQSGIKTIYQTKYVYDEQPITSGAGADGTEMWLATLRENDTRFSKVAIKMLMVFPYSMCKFLIERQLKKRGLTKLSK